MLPQEFMLPPRESQVCLESALASSVNCGSRPKMIFPQVYEKLRRKWQVLKLSRSRQADNHFFQNKMSRCIISKSSRKKYTFQKLLLTVWLIVVSKSLRIWYYLFIMKDFWLNYFLYRLLKDEIVASFKISMLH